MDVFVADTDESHAMLQHGAGDGMVAAAEAAAEAALANAKAAGASAEAAGSSRLNVLVSPLGGRAMSAAPPPPGLMSPLGVGGGSLVGSLVLQPRLPAPPRDTPSRKRAYNMPVAPVGDDRDVQFAQALQQRPKIPRPPNAFMLFANEWRKKLAMQFPSESNKDISVRLGGMWKGLEKDSKEQYFALARQVDAEHKRKYPDYVYNPKEARLRKALREQSRENRSSLSRAHSAALLHQQQQQQAQQQQVQQQQAAAQRAAQQQLPSASAWGRTSNSSGPAPFGGTVTPARSLRPNTSKVLMDRSIEDMRSKIREQVEQGLVSNYPETMMEFEPVTTYSLGQMGMPAGGEYAVVSDIDNHGWYSFAQASQHAGSPYVMRHTDDKLLSGNWNIHYATDGHTQQGVPYLMRPQMVSSSGPFNSTLNQSPLTSVNGHGINRSGSSQQSYQVFTPISSASSQPNNNIIKKQETNDEDQNRILDNTPTSSPAHETISSIHPKTVVSNTNNSTTTDSMPSSQTEGSGNKKTVDNSALSPSAMGSEKNVNSDSSAENRPLPTFEQAFGSTEIGRYSHEGIFSGTQHNTQHQGPQNSDPKYILGKSSGTYDALPNTSLFNSPCDDFQHGFAPFILSSPSGKLESSESLLPQSSWPSMFYYTPAAIPLPAAFFDYALLPGVPAGTDFIPTGPDDAVLIDIPNAPGVYNRNDFQVACNGERSSMFGAENSFRDCEEGLGYVTLHIPATTMQTVNTFSMQTEPAKTSQPMKTEPFLDKTGKESPTILTKQDVLDEESKSKQKVSGLDEGEKQTEESKNESAPENSDELKRQNLTITGMPMQEPIVISQNERICVIMDAPTSDTDYSGF